MRCLPKFVASLVGVALLASAATAAPKKPSAAVIDPIREGLSKLTLTEEQKTKTDAILTDAEAKYEAAIAENKGKKLSDEEKKESQKKRQELIKQVQTDINAVLTPEQQKEFKAAVTAAKKAAMDAKKGTAKPAEPAAPAN